MRQPHAAVGFKNSPALRSGIRRGVLDRPQRDPSGLNRFTSEVLYIRIQGDLLIVPSFIWKLFVWMCLCLLSTLLGTCFQIDFEFLDWPLLNTPRLQPRAKVISKTYSSMLDDFGRQNLPDIFRLDDFSKGLVWEGLTNLFIIRRN